MRGIQERQSSWVLKLVFINGIIFLIRMATLQVQYSYTLPFGTDILQFQRPAIDYFFGLSPSLVLAKGFIWQFVSYMFLHGDFIHILFNMYMLFLFGMPIEQVWGSKRFLFYYFFTGVGAGLTIFILNMVMMESGYWGYTVGASGAVFGVLLAFGVLFPDIELLLFFVMPIKAKYLVILYGGIELFMLLGYSGQSNISHIGHLGGLFFGILYFVIMRRRGIEFKVKRFKAQSRQGAARRTAKPAISESDNVARLKNILIKVRELGPESLDEDEYQHIKLMEILHDEEAIDCPKEPIPIDLAKLQKLDNPELCLLAEIKKYL